MNTRKDSTPFRTTRAAASAALAISLLFLASSCSSAPPTGGQGNPTAAHSEDAPPLLTFDRPREVVVEGKSISAALITFEATPDHLALLYALAGDVKFAASAPDVSLVDDEGQVYTNLSSIAVGVPEGVFIGLLVTEPYRPGAPDLSLRIGQVTDVEGRSVDAGLDLPVATNTRPDEPVDFYEGGRYGDDAGIRIRDATVGVAGPPRTSQTHALVYRSGHASVVHAIIDEARVARLVSPDQLRYKPPLPPGFPWPEDQPY